MNTRCHEKTTANLVDVPEESCDLQPQKTCGLDHDVGILIIKKPLQIGDASRAKFEANKGVCHGTPGLFVTQYINLCLVFYVFRPNTVSCFADQIRIIYNLYVFSTGDLHAEI